MLMSFSFAIMCVFALCSIHALENRNIDGDSLHFVLPTLNYSQLLANGAPLYDVYERCMLSLPESEWNTRTNFYTQPKCLHLLNINVSSHHSILSLHSTSTEYIHTLPKFCLVRYLSTQPRILNIPIAYAKPRLNCSTRDFFEKDFNKVWIHSDGNKNEEIRSSALETIRTIRGVGARYLTFIGDSMNHGAFKHMVCDTVRSGGRIRKEDFDDFIFSFSGTADKHRNVSFHDEQVVVEKYLLYWPGTESKMKSLEIKDRFRDELETFAKTMTRGADEGLVVAINFGLHSHRFPSQYTDIARALLDFAKAHAYNTFVIFIETYSQHFGYSYNGQNQVYISDDSIKLRKEVPSQCCSKERDIVRMKSDILLIAALDELDANWRDYIGWVNTSVFSSKLTTLHEEVNSKGQIDCTHYAYSPYMLSFVYQQISTEVLRLNNKRKATK